MEPVVDVQRGDRHVDPQERSRVRWRRGARQDAEPRDERVPALGREFEAGGAGVAAVAREQVRGRFERGEVERAVAPAGGTDRLPSSAPTTAGRP